MEVYQYIVLIANEINSILLNGLACICLSIKATKINLSRSTITSVLSLDEQMNPKYPSVLHGLSLFQETLT